MDYAYRETDRELAELEKRISEVYADASKELQTIIDDYFDKLVDRDEHQRELMEAGQITKEQYQLWRMAQIGRGERYIALQNEIAQRCNQANQVALSYVNDTTPGIYSLNYNYSAYTIEKVHGNVGFTLFDEQTVRRLLADDPELLPAPRIDIPLDLKWNKQKLQRELVTGIMLGESTDKLATRFQSVTDMNRVSALRNARTALTGAQNAGRQDSMLRAKEMGINQKKMWIAANDFRTRHSHGMLDGTTVEVDEFFISENGSKMMYPGDRNHGAKPCDIYNCRCTVVTDDPAVVDDEPYETYSEWYNRKRKEDPVGFELEFKKVRNQFADQKQFTKYGEVLGKNAPKTFADFQNLKYNNTERWSFVKLDYKRRNDLMLHPEKALPNAKDATAAEPKFLAYLFNPENQRGWNKGKLFTERLGYSADNWKSFRNEILRGAKLYPATNKGNNGFGDLYEQKMILYGMTGDPTNILVSWIHKPDGTTALTSAYIKEV